MQNISDSKRSEHKGSKKNTTSEPQTKTKLGGAAIRRLANRTGYTLPSQKEAI